MHVYETELSSSFGMNKEKQLDLNLREKLANTSPTEPPRPNVGSHPILSISLLGGASQKPFNLKLAK